MDVYNMKSKEEWQKILDDVYQELGIAAYIFDDRNGMLQSSGERTELCRRIRETDEGLTFICSQSQQYMAEQAKTTQAPVIDACEAGMAKFVVPIVYKEKWIGSISACGACLPGEEIEDFLIQQNTGIKEKELDRLKKGVPEIDKAQLDNSVRRLLKKIR